MFTLVKKLRCLREKVKKNFQQPSTGLLPCSVPDPRHFGVDPDPDPRIHASD